MVRNKLGLPIHKKEKLVLHAKARVLLVGIVFFFSVTCVFAQSNKYVAYFTDKNNSAYSTEHPEAFLSQRAIERRRQQNIPIEEKDFPVNAIYLKGLKEAGGRVIYTSRWFNAALFEGPDDLIESLEALPYIDSIELARPGNNGGRKKHSGQKQTFLKDVETEMLPQEELANFLQNEMLGINKMHARNINGKGKLIAVFDGGFNGVNTAPYFTHIFENNQYVDGYDFVGNSDQVFRYGQHGTEALSCIAAYLPGQLEAGAYGSDIMLCVTEESGSEYRIEEYYWLFAAERADSVGADIISTSLGYTTFDDDSMNYSYDDLNGETTVITRAANFATQAGMVCVVSAGNEGAYNWKYVSAPADAPNILSVGAVSAEKNRASFSSIGPTADGRIKPEVSALGLQTVVGDANGNITTANGTSFSAPLIAGLVAGFWQNYPNLTNLELVEAIKMSSTSAMVPNNEIGYGIPDFNKALQVLSVEPESARQSHFNVYPNPILEGKLFIESLEKYQGDLLIIILQSSTGQTLINRTFSTVSGHEQVGMDISSLPSGVYILQIFSATHADMVKLIKF